MTDYTFYSHFFHSKKYHTENYLDCVYCKSEDKDMDEIHINKQTPVTAGEVLQAAYSAGASIAQIAGVYNSVLFTIPISNMGLYSSQQLAQIQPVPISNMGLYSSQQLTQIQPVPPKPKTNHIITILYTNGDIRSFTFTRTGSYSDEPLNYTDNGVIAHLGNEEKEIIFVPYQSLLRIEERELGHRDFEPELAAMGKDEKEKD